jgi:hypothetical protein
LDRICDAVASVIDLHHCIDIIADRWLYCQAFRPNESLSCLAVVRWFVKTGTIGQFENKKNSLNDR